MLKCFLSLIKRRNFLKKIFYSVLFVEFLLFYGIINLFLKINSDFNHIIGINIILTLNLFMVIVCKFFIDKAFKKNNLSNSQNYRKDLKNVFANSFLKTSAFSILFALIIYGFLKNFLQMLNINEGIINYCVFASKIWFISSPFFGLEVLIFKYFEELDFFKKPIIISIFKIIIYFAISFLFFIKYQNNCIMYAKPVCDFIFLVYYSKICFDITHSNKTI